MESTPNKIGKYYVHLLYIKKIKDEERIQTVDKIKINTKNVETIKDLKYYIINKYKKQKFCPCMLSISEPFEDSFFCSDLNDSPEKNIDDCFCNENIYIIINYKKTCYCGFNEINSLTKIEIFEFYKNKIEEFKKAAEKKLNDANSKIKELEELNKDIISLYDQELKRKTEENTINIESSSKLTSNSDDSNKNIIFFNQNIFDVKFEDFYDVIFDINSIKDINIGWEIKMNKNGEKRFNEYKNKEALIIGVIGNSNRGKSFLLSKISKINLPNGTSIRTEGLSIKYPDLEKFVNRKIILLDSAGLETPLLLDKTNNITDENINEILKEKARDKLSTEIFLQNFIINNSDSLITVVGILTYSEQKLLNRIREERIKTKKMLVIIHNLMTFSYIKQVEQYINNYLLKDATFDLEERKSINTKINNTKNVPYYYERNKSIKIFHLIFANEGSEAGNYYNDFALDFIENTYQTFTDIRPFDCIQRLKERFIELSKELIEKNENNLYFKEDDFIDNDSILKEKRFGLKSKRDIILKKCYIDELGFSNFRNNGFNPNYNYYKKGNKLIIKAEIPGNYSLKCEKKYSGNFTIIELKGNKYKDKEPEKIEDNIHNTREYGDFIIDIPLILNLYDKDPIIEKKNGIIKIEYEIREETKIFYEFKIDEEI